MPHEGNVRVDPASLILFAVPILLIAFMFNAQRKRQRTFEQLQGSLASGQDVVTTSGLFARIVEIDETAAVLQVAPGVQVRWDRRAIATIAAPADVGAPTSPEA